MTVVEQILTWHFEISLLRNTTVNDRLCSVKLQPCFCHQAEARLICEGCRSEHEQHTTTSDLRGVAAVLLLQLKQGQAVYSTAVTSIARASNT